MSYPTPDPDMDILALQIYVFLKDAQERPWVQKIPSSHIDSVERAARSLHHHKLAAFSESLAHCKEIGISPYPTSWVDCPETVRQLLDLVRCSVLGDPVRWSPADLSKILKVDSTPAVTTLPGGVALENDEIEQYPGLEFPRSEGSAEDEFYPTYHSRTSEDSILGSDDFSIDTGQPRVLDTTAGIVEEAAGLPEHFNFSTVRFNLGRLQKRCQQLSPHIKKWAPWLAEEDRMLVQLRSQYGLSYSQIAHDYITYRRLLGIKARYHILQANGKAPYGNFTVDPIFQAGFRKGTTVAARMVGIDLVEEVNQGFPHLWCMNCALEPDLTSLILDTCHVAVRGRCKGCRTYLADDTRKKTDLIDQSQCIAVHPAAWPQLKHLQDAFAVYISCLKAEQVEYDAARAAYEGVGVAADALKEACNGLPRIPQHEFHKMISPPDSNLRQANQANSISEEGMAAQSPLRPASSEPCQAPATPSSMRDGGHRSSKEIHGRHVQFTLRNAPAEKESEGDMETSFMRKVSEFSSSADAKVARLGLAAHPHTRQRLVLRDVVSWRDIKTTLRSMLCALLHLCGEEQQPACSNCQESQGPFAHCIQFPYQQSQIEARCCTNCLYRWQSSGCNLPDRRQGRPRLGVDLSIRTIMELYEQWYEGRNGNPPFVHLDRLYGHLWEKKMTGNWKYWSWSFTRERRLMAAIDIVAKERQISSRSLCSELDELIEPLWGDYPRTERMNHRLLYLTSPREKETNLKHLYLTIPQDTGMDSLSNLIQHIRTFHTWEGPIPKFN